MSKSIIHIIYAFCLMSFCYSTHAQELYKCVTNQGTSYQSSPCSSKASQKIACTGSAADGFNGECESLEQRRMQAISNEKNAYTQDLASNNTKNFKELWYSSQSVNNVLCIWSVWLVIRVIRHKPLKIIVDYMLQEFALMMEVFI